MKTRYASLPFTVLLVSCGNGTGSLSSSLLTDLDTSQLISMSRAAEIAVAEVGGFAVRAELELEDDDENEPPAWEVTVFVSGANDLMEVEVHAMSGEVLEVEVSDDGMEDDEGANDDPGE